jgi:hypothetical protein
MEFITKYGPEEQVSRKFPKPKKNNDNVFECHYCDYKTKLQSTFNMHLAIKHCDSRPHACKECDESFYTSTLLRQHVNSIHKVADVKCPQCTSVFKTKAIMQTHYARFHMKREDLIEDPDYKTNNAFCKSCETMYPKNGIMYHVVKCNPASPWCAPCS